MVNKSTKKFEMRLLRAAPLRVKNFYRGHFLFYYSQYRVTRNGLGYLHDAHLEHVDEQAVKKRVDPERDCVYQQDRIENVL